MRKIWEKWNEWSLILRILCGMIIGTILALAIPGIAAVELLGTLFVSALKAVAPILVFFLIIAALTNATKMSSMKRIVVLYAVSTLLAGIVSVLACYIFPLHLTLVEAADKSAPSGVAEVLGNLLMNVVSNPVESLTKGNFLGILAWAVLLGIALRHASDSTKTVFNNIAEAIQKVVRWVIAFAPFGVMGLVYNAVATSGIQIFTEYGALILVLVGCMFFIAFVANPLMVWANIHRNPYPLVLRTLKDSAITAFFTRSSAANIPINLELCRRLGLNEDNYSVSIPLGATVNMSGACVTITVMAMAAAQTLGVQVDFITAVILCVLAAVSAAGASGVAGGSLLLIPVACSLLGLPNDIAMQVVGIGFIIGVIQDSCETALNSSSDALFTATAEYALWNKAGVDYKPGEDHEPVVV